MITIKEIQKMLIKVKESISDETEQLRNGVTSYSAGLHDGYKLCADVYEVHINSICGIIQMWLDEDERKQGK